MRRLYSYKYLILIILTVASVTAQAELPVLRIQDYPGMVSPLPRIAIQKGYCTKHGIQCKLVTLPSAPLGIQTLVAGDIDVSATPPSVAIQSVAHGLKVKIVEQAGSKSVFMLVLGKDLMNSGAGDKRNYKAVMHALKGKKVGVTARGAAPEFQMKTMLADAGMQANDVSFVAVGGAPTAYPALISGRIDALMGFTPIGGFCDVLKTCKISILLAADQGPKELDGLASGYFMMRRDYTSKHPEIVKAFVAAMQDSARFIKNPSNLDELFKITKMYYQIKVPQGDDILRSALKRFQPYFGGGTSGTDRHALKKAADYLYSTKQIEQPIDIKKLL